MSALTEPTFAGHRPTGAGDLSVETHGIAPIAEDQRYGSPARLFTVWFAPQVNMTGVFTGALAIVLGLGFWLGLLAMVIGTVLGSLTVGYLSTWGPRTGTGQLPNSRMAFGGGVVLPAVLQWLGTIAWDALVGLFGGEALSVLLGVPFWLGVLIVLALQGAAGFFGYEVIHRMQAVLIVVLFVTFVVFAVKLVAGAGVRVHVCRNCFGVHLHSGHRHRGRECGLRADGGGRAIGDGRRSAWRAGAAHHRAGVDWLGCDERLQRLAGAADDRGAGAAAGVGRDRDAPGLSAHPLATRRRHREPLPECAAVGELLDPGVCLGRGHRLAAAYPGPRDHQPGRGADRAPRRGRSGDRVRARLRRGDSVHEHVADRGPGRAGVARRRRRVLRQSAGGCGAVRRLPAAAVPRVRVGWLTCGADEVVDQVRHFGWPLDVREVADAFEHLKPAPWPR